MSYRFQLSAQAELLLSDGKTSNYGAQAIAQRIAELTQMLDGLAPEVPIGLIGDNSPEWILADLAMLEAGRCAVPIPAFFTPEQVTHLVAATGMTTVFHNGALLPVGAVFPYLPASTPRSVVLPPLTQKITFTSGTTGTPKGVCLTAGQQMATVEGLAAVLGGLGIKRHLSLLPLAVLLENIAGIYVPLMLGAQCFVPPLAETGLSGSSQFDAERCLNAIAQYQAESIILLPQMLQAIVWTAQVADPRLATLKFVAVGGGVTPLAVLARAAEIGMPVYEGYGLSECASVVSLNTPSGNAVGSVGRTLPGVTARIAADGEIEVQGRGYAGFLGDPVRPEASWIATGDLGTLDDNGFLRITGRKKNVLITSFGRNISPEWPERLLMESGMLAQAVVIGDGQAHLSAVLVPRDKTVLEKDVAERVKKLNEHLPDYAQIAQWTLFSEGFTSKNGLSTENGRPRRDAIAQKFLINDVKPQPIKES
jgi:long-subunit acyl-CoA synthetase (AMP-forming)